MKLWTSAMLEMRRSDWLRATTKRGKIAHDGGICCEALSRHIEMPRVGSDVWLVIHDRPGEDRVCLTMPESDLLFIEGEKWSYVCGGDRRILRDLGLADGPREALYLEVWYRD